MANPGEDVPAFDADPLSEVDFDAKPKLILNAAGELVLADEAAETPPEDPPEKPNDGSWQQPESFDALLAEDGLVLAPPVKPPASKTVPEPIGIDEAATVAAPAPPDPAPPESAAAPPVRAAAPPRRPAPDDETPPPPAQMYDAAPTKPAARLDETPPPPAMMYDAAPTKPTARLDGAAPPPKPPAPVVEAPPPRFTSAPTVPMGRTARDHSEPPREAPPPPASPPAPPPARARLVSGLEAFAETKRSITEEIEVDEILSTAPDEALVPPATESLGGITDDLTLAPAVADDIDEDEDIALDLTEADVVESTPIPEPRRASTRTQSHLSRATSTVSPVRAAAPSSAPQPQAPAPAPPRRLASVVGRRIREKKRSPDPAAVSSERRGEPFFERGVQALEAGDLVTAERDIALALSYAPSDPRYRRAFEELKRRKGR